jgi:ribonuclease PH
MALTRSAGRTPEDIRRLTIEPHVSPYAEGSCLICVGNTHVICTASVDEKVPPFLRGAGKGWVTAEYGMLPRATHSRMDREAARGKQSGRTQEIQRLIGRSLRAIIDLKKLGERQIKIDCDVIRADGGTRTTSITGAWVALSLAVEDLMQKGLIAAMPLHDQVAAISCGLVAGEALADLDYNEDSNAETDANFVLTASGGIVEIQGTAEQHPFSETQLMEMMALAKKGCQHLFEVQMQAVRTAKP